MNDDDEKPEPAKVLRKQLGRPDYRDALRTKYKAVPTDEQFEDLLKRLAETEDYD
jgi:hypothetical protein